MIDEYLAQCGKEQMTLPTRIGFAKFIGVQRQLVLDWEKAKDAEGNLIHTEFKEALEKIDDAQKQQLMDDGLYGGKEVNSTMAIFLLKVNHDMIEKSALDLTSQGEKIAPMVVLDTKKE